MAASLSTVAKRLVSAGHTIKEITELLYGHPGTQAFYTIKYATRKAVDAKAVARRLREDGYTREEVLDLITI